MSPHDPSTRSGCFPGVHDHPTVAVGAGGTRSHSFSRKTTIMPLSLPSSPFSPDPRARESARDRALVLGGGGSTGNAWMLGVLAGLLHEGVDAAAAELLIGTSAGATTAAQISFRSPIELHEATIADRRTGTADPAGAASPTGAGRAPRPAHASVAEQLDRTSRIIAAAADPADMRRSMGAAAMQLDGASDPERSARWRAVVASRLPDQRWPARDLRIVAVDAADGSPVVFDRDSGVGLADAVAASCASGAPHHTCGRFFIDGGYRRNENADLAVGSERVLVLSPFGGRTRHPLEWRMQLAAQTDDLRAAGSTVEVVGPDEDTARLIGANAMDPSLRPDTARAGFAQGVRLADRLGAFWN